jgi:prephenate dehydrogenase
MGALTGRRSVTNRELLTRVLDVVRSRKSMPESPRTLPVVPPPNPGGDPVFERIAIVGLGLIGGSLALAARATWPSALVIGVDRNDVLEKAIVRHAIDVASDNLMIASEADLVVLAAPVGRIVEIVPVLPQHVAAHAVITDVGSTKREVVAAAAGLPERLTFIGGHPLAGSVRSGIEAARPDLFAGRPWLFTPTPGQPEEPLSRLRAFVERLGARPVTIESPAAHDHLVAFLSHLPQLVASTLMGVIGEEIGAEGLDLAGRGLIDTTRLAGGRAELWQDVCRTNDDEVGAALDAFIRALQSLRDGLAEDETVGRVFDAANRWRQRLDARRA